MIRHGERRQINKGAVRQGAVKTTAADDDGGYVFIERKYGVAHDACPAPANSGTCVIPQTAYIGNI
eukprot:scaffold371695_cov31-Prasinocladus_malaysianus.AAC.1